MDPSSPSSPSSDYSGISKNSQSQETGMAMVLLCLLVAMLFDIPQLYPVAIVLQVVTMTIPLVFKPLSVIWFGLSRVLGFIVTNIILCTLFFFIVTPVAIVRRLLGSDPLTLKEWKKGRRSIFKVRDHLFESNELFKPY